MTKSSVIIKTMLLFVGLLCFANIGSALASGTIPPQREIEINSGNIVTVFDCPVTATFCDLMYQGIIGIATDTFINHTSLELLDLRFNHITSLESGDFNGLTSLTNLRLGNNKIASLENGDLNGLSSVIQLDLSYNYIASLENGVFNGLSNVRYLGLANNQITALDNFVFSGLSNLKEFRLGYNQITSIKRSTFSGLSQMTHLYLNSNQISSLEHMYFDGLPSLIYLDLSINHLTSIKKNNLNGLTGLITLYLQANKIMYIESGAFSAENGFSHLNTLFLHTNCSTSGNIMIPFNATRTTPMDSNNCVLVNGTASNSFIANLIDKGYIRSGNYYFGNYAISFNHPTAKSRILAPIIMKSTNIHGYPQSYYQNPVYIQYESGTNILFDGGMPDGGTMTGIINGRERFNKVLQSPFLFTPQNVPGLTNVISLMRFGALTDKIDFSLAVTIRMPVPGKKTGGDSVNIYTTEQESIYGASQPDRRIERMATVTMINKVPYVEFVVNHAGRYAVRDNVKSKEASSISINTTASTAAKQPILRIRERGGTKSLLQTTIEQK